jgi:ribosomal protein S18 acetylase RimI-like enzyme
MIQATPADKTLVVDILVKSFDDNKSVNYIVKQDEKRAGRLRKLMEYSFEKCSLFGDIFLSDDKKACALVVLPDQKKTTLQSITLDLDLVLSVIGLLNVKKALTRETRINQLHPKTHYYFLWFLGVEPLEQNKGIGSKLLTEVIGDAISKGRPIYLETSTLKNIPWYEKFGFAIYNKLDFGFDLYCLKKE